MRWIPFSFLCCWTFFTSWLRQCSSDYNYWWLPFVCCLAILCKTFCINTKSSEDCKKLAQDWLHIAKEKFNCTANSIVTDSARDVGETKRHLKDENLNSCVCLASSITAQTWGADRDWHHLKNLGPCSSVKDLALQLHPIALAPDMCHGDICTTAESCHAWINL